MRILHPAIRQASPLWAALGMLACLARLAGGGEIPLQPRDAELPKRTMPDEFALVFSFGYVSDFMPKDEATFESLLQNMKRTG